MFRLSASSPVQWPKPVNTMAPTPLDSRAGSITANSCGPPTPATSISSTAATSGLPKIAEMAAAAPAAPSSAVLGSVAGARARSRKSQRQTAAQGDQRCLGPEHGAQRQAGQGGEDHPGNSGFGRASRMQARRRNVPASAGKTQDDQGDDRTRHQSQGERPPPRRSRPPEVVRPVHPDQMSPARGAATRNQNAANDTGIPIRRAEHQRPPVLGPTQHVPQLVGFLGLVSRSGLGGLSWLLLGDGASPESAGRRFGQMAARDYPPDHAIRPRSPHKSPKPLRMDAGRGQRRDVRARQGSMNQRRAAARGSASQWWAAEPGWLWVG